jgi:citrate lyase subunit beta/citryl-CoA lyase
MAGDTRPAVTWLFVPGDRPDRFDKAQAAGADEIICDLEDAVLPGAKDRARDDVCGWLAAAGAAWVRVNAVGTQWHDDDVKALAQLPGLRGVIVPKSEQPDALIAVGQGVGAEAGLIALVESALGIHNAYAIAQCGSVNRLGFGSIDFSIDIDAEESDESLLLARSTLVLASRVAGKPAPIDGVTTAVDDPGAATAAAHRARRTGFGGKFCIHPNQIDPVAAGFRPSDDEIRWARDVIQTSEQSRAGATTVNGAMIDKPVLARAHRILAATRSTP